MCMNYDSAYQSIIAWVQQTMAWFSNSTSAMDLHTAVICAGVFVISALVVYLISVFGMRERTYEEAIEEQRRRQQEAVQQAKSDKSKKDKKFKKWGKKSKEKPEEDKNITCDVGKVLEESEAKLDSELTNINGQADLKVSSLKRKGRQKKLTKQDKTEELSQPQSSSEDTDEPASISTACSNNLSAGEEEKKGISLDKNAKLKEESKSQTSESSLDLPDEKFGEVESLKIIKSPGKNNQVNKMDNPEFSRECEINEWTEMKLLNVIKISVFTEDEIQHLIDALNNKINRNAAEKKKIEVSSLKKMIQEKEEALKCEQKLCQATTDQMNDLIQQLSEKKAQASATEKSLRDALHQEQQEIKALHGMMQRKREQYASELASMQSKMQQMKNKMKEEHSLALQRLQDENNQLQSLNRIESEKQQRSSLEIQRLQHEIEQLRTSREKFETHQAAMQQSQEELHRQIQQLEKHIEQLVTSHQEEEYSYKQRINEMGNKIQQTENARSSLVQELQNAQAVCSTLETDNTSLRQRLDEAKHQINHSEDEILQLQSRLEESNHQQCELTNCLEKLRDEVVELSNAKHDHVQVIQSLKQEYESLISQKEHNGETSQKGKSADAEEYESIIIEKEAVVHRLIQELEQSKQEFATLSGESDCLKEKNKELLNEKKKVSEALHAAEMKLKDVIETAEKKVQQAQIRVDNCSQDMQNILNEQIREVELSLQENCSREIMSMKEEADKIKKDADEKILKAETQANLRLEEFQESLYERLHQMNFESEEKIREAVKEKELLKEEFENVALSAKKFLQKIFPNIGVPEGFDELSMCDYEKEVKYHLEKQNNLMHDSKDLEDMIKKLEENTAERMNLESQIKNYESILAETETILKTVQSNIENEEQKWKIDLQNKDETLKELMNENENLKSQNRHLQTNLEQLEGLKEALYEIEELQLKLQKEELEKKLLEEKLSALDCLSNSSSISVSDYTSGSNILPTKSEKRKKSRKRGASGKK